MFHLGSKLNVKPQEIAITYIITIIFVITNCGSVVLYHSIFDTAPCAPYNSGNGPNIISTRDGLSLGVNGRYLSMMADTVETVHASGGGISLFQYRLNRWSEIGVLLSACALLGSEEYENPNFYLVCDGKACLIEKSIIISINPGVGIGTAEAGYGFDFRCASFFGKSTFDGILVPYIGPRVIALRYIWRRIVEAPGIVTHTDGALTWMYGMTAGVDFNAYSPSKNFQIHLIPEITLLKGNEASLDRVDYTIVEPSIMLRVLF